MPVEVVKNVGFYSHEHLELIPYSPRTLEYRDLLLTKYGGLDNSKYLYVLFSE